MVFCTEADRCAAVVGLFQEEEEAAGEEHEILISPLPPRYIWCTRPTESAAFSESPSEGRRRAGV